MARVSRRAVVLAERMVPGDCSKSRQMMPLGIREPTDYTNVNQQTRSPEFRCLIQVEDAASDRAVIR